MSLLWYRFLVLHNGMRSSALVELIDIFPTITELAGLEVLPVCSGYDKQQLTCIEGTNLTSLLMNLDQQWKKAAFSLYPHPCYGMHQILNEPQFDNEHGENVMGYTVSVDQYHFTEWYRFNRTTATPNWTDIWEGELNSMTTLNQLYSLTMRILTWLMIVISRIWLRSCERFYKLDGELLCHHPPEACMERQYQK